MGCAQVLTVQPPRRSATILLQVRHRTPRGRGVARDGRLDLPASVVEAREIVQAWPRDQAVHKDADVEILDTVAAELDPAVASERGRDRAMHAVKCPACVRPRRLLVGPGCGRWAAFASAARDAR
eukprot:5406301-Prymnesium_polylepis.1